MADFRDFVRVFIFTFIVVSVNGLRKSFTAGVSQTLGQPWPMPQVYKPTSDVYRLNGEYFQFRVGDFRCEILDNALIRYYKLFFSDRDNKKKNSEDETLRFNSKVAHSAIDDYPQLYYMWVTTQTPCDNVMPSLEMKEDYVISVSKQSINASTIWGALRGLETFSQLIYESGDGQWLINGTEISDYPRFAHRGALLDTARHFLPVDVIKEHLDAMAYNKMNVFHWHIVDDQSFPYQSYVYPALSFLGSYDPYTHVYTQSDIADIIEYSRMRGIRVVAEFDSPGHTEAWGWGQPGLLPECFDSHGQWDGSYGPVDPSYNGNYKFLQLFTKELSQVFPDKYIHLGGDEVDFTCWKSNPRIQNFMKTMGFGTDYSKLEGYYMQKLLDIVAANGNGYVIWQEVIDNGVKVKPDTVVEVWKDGQEKELAKVTSMGLRALLSSCWYLDGIGYGEDWINFYKCDPYAFNGTAQQKALVIGGEMCLWGEFVDATNVISRMWPRGSAVAERLWSSASVIDVNEASLRLEEHRCRMIRRGLNVEPVVGPGYCRHEYRPRY